MSEAKARHLWRLRYLEWRFRSVADDVQARREGLARAEARLAELRNAAVAAREEIVRAVSA